MAIKDEKTAADNQAAADEVGAGQVQAKFDEANEKGFFGEQVDETPRDEFTLKGVANKKP